MFSGFLFLALSSLPAPDLIVDQVGKVNQLRLDGGQVFRSTLEIVTSPSTMKLNDGTVIGFWQEGKTPRYLVSLDGKAVAREVEASYNVELRYSSFDPLKRTPKLISSLETSQTNDVYIVQFKTQPLDIYRAEIEALGGELYNYITNHAFICRIPTESKAQVSALPFVRWVGAYETSYRLDPEITSHLNTSGSRRYNIVCHKRGRTMQDSVASLIRLIGGTIDETTPQGFRMSATLNSTELKQVLALNEVAFVDLWGAPESDMDLVRQYGGGTFIDTLGFTGQGVRAEVMDGGLRVSHQAFQTNPPILHGTVSNDSHGTATYGINFGNGAGNASGRGMMPNAQGVIAGYPSLTNRYTHTAQLLSSPYFCVYQSNSWGSSLTTAYNSISAEMDDILYLNDITILNSQSNAGTRNSRPQAWAKNVVSIGAFNHYGNLNDADDRWANGASIGPAADGRVKPELAFWYDGILTTTSTNDTAYTSSFGGTSAATPITAGHFGLFFQMWHNGVFGVSVPAATVFDNRPKATLAKAVMINTARQKPLPAPFDITRNVQGWGVVNVQDLYNARNKMLTINETIPLNNLQTATLKVSVASGEPSLKLTMAYTDPAGTVGASVARKNNLSLKVTGPTGTVWWGNSGMANANWTSSGGAEDTINTVENVFIQSPPAGIYTVEVIGSDINTDARPETAGINADFALVATGVQNGPLAPLAFSTDGTVISGGLGQLGLSDNSSLQIGSLSTNSRSRYSAGVIMTFTSPLQSHSSGRIVLERKSSINDLAETVDVLNPTTGMWVNIGSGTPGATDSTVEYTIPNISTFVSSPREIKIRTSYAKFDSQLNRNASVDVDYARLLLQP